MQGFFDTKARVRVLDGDEPVYAVFRGAGSGPGLYKNW